MAMDEEDHDMQDDHLQLEFDGSNGFQVNEDGSVEYKCKINKDQLECCICYGHMTGCIYRCKNPGPIVHNVCSDCEWQLRRIQEQNGHVNSQRCPICKIEGLFLRNNTLENELIPYTKPCKNSLHGCSKTFFLWNSEIHEEHESMCIYSKVKCPLCNNCIDGIHTLVDHLSGGDCCHRFSPLESAKTVNKRKAVFITTGNHYYFHNMKEHYVIVFVWKGTYFDIAAFCLDGNNNLFNQQVYLTITNNHELKAYQENFNTNTNYHISLPMSQKFSINMNSLFFSTPKAKIKWSQYFVGETSEPITFVCKYLTLAENMEVGCTLDCRDSFGKWYEAEVLQYRSENACSVTGLGRRNRILVHYLGYSSNYDEWFDLASDTSRIAPIGTHTVGPNLRTVRRTSFQNFLSNNQCPNFRNNNRSRHSRMLQTQNSENTLME